VQAVRWSLFVIVAVGFFLTALSGDVYNLTSPATLTWHVALRKFYSIVAGASLRTSALVVAVYSGAIEIGQHLFTDPNEPLGWNIFDVGCGAVGGALAGLIPWVRAK
jgi:hypothetical protein